MAFARPLIRAAVDQARDPIAALERTNRILVEERRSSLFITALSGRSTPDERLAPRERRPRAAAVVRPGRRPPIRWLTGSGPLLGAFPELDLDRCEVQLAPGDLILLYTDGVTDARAAIRRAVRRRAAARGRRGRPGRRSTGRRRRGRRGDDAFQGDDARGGRRHARGGPTPPAHHPAQKGQPRRTRAERRSPATRACPFGHDPCPNAPRARGRPARYSTRGGARSRPTHSPATFSVPRDRRGASRTRTRRRASSGVPRRAPGLASPPMARRPTTTAVR